VCAQHDRWLEGESPSETWLRQVYLKQWKRGPTIYRELRARGASDALARSVAFGAKRWWHHASLRINQVLTNAHFEQLGVPRLAA
jgi:RNA-directed DNA polymerase